MSLKTIALAGVLIAGTVVPSFAASAFHPGQSGSDIKLDRMSHALDRSSSAVGTHGAAMAGAAATPLFSAGRSQSDKKLDKMSAASKGTLKWDSSESRAQGADMQRYVINPGS
ncbi:hypothetical protein HDIA_4086 [Hartmannibacter diazotrophicus]|uniref:Uncharacterized protein n=2 Tax=Hartmannibacter diazotrophicus TaxID=1482074 RepID=A0A2C9DBF4_9HYPH|nr:hypothetical protein HDIA_4086 [Hartmannibacter diazotrophicus]